MTDRAIARRYARALFDVTAAEGDLDRVERELEAFAAVVRDHGELRAALTHPAVSPSRKRAVVAALVERAGPVTPALAKLLLLVAERDRIRLLPELVEAFRERLLEHRRIVRAEVTAAVALPPDRLQALADGLSRATGREVRLEVRVDPSIIGGAVARVGSLVVDGSVAGQLERLKAELAAPRES